MRAEPSVRPVDARARLARHKHPRPAGLAILAMIRSIMAAVGTSHGQKAPEPQEGRTLHQRGYLRQHGKRGKFWQRGRAAGSRAMCFIVTFAATTHVSEPVRKRRLRAKEQGLCKTMGVDECGLAYA
jgi:hypothetical protein